MFEKTLKMLTQLTYNFERAEGRSTDEYCATARYQPMAEGKYLSALATVKQLGKISEADYRKKVAASERRLWQANVGARGQAAWGLGFEWNGRPANEPYLITTAVIFLGILENAEALSKELFNATLTHLARFEPLIDVSHRGQTIQVPAFSPLCVLPVHNVVAMWAAAVLDPRAAAPAETQARARQSLDWVWDHFRAPIGWTYAPGNHRADLLHECYIVYALARQHYPGIEERALQVVTKYLTHGVLLDKMDIGAQQTAFESFKRASSVDVFPVGKEWVVRHGTPARTWATGELIQLAGWFAAHGQCKSFWNTFAYRIYRKVLLPIILETPTRFRESMHVAHGLSRLLWLQETAQAKEAGRAS